MSVVKEYKMFSSGMAGSGIHDVNARFRMYLVVTVGIFAFGSVLFWRTQLLLASEYVEMPQHKVRKTGQAKYFPSEIPEE